MANARRNLSLSMLYAQGVNAAIPLLAFAGYQVAIRLGLVQMVKSRVFKPKEAESAISDYLAKNPSVRSKASSGKLGSVKDALKNLFSKGIHTVRHDIRTAGFVQSAKSVVMKYSGILIVLSFAWDVLDIASDYAKLNVSCARLLPPSVQKNGWSGPKKRVRCTRNEIKALALMAYDVGAPLAAESLLKQIDDSDNDVLYATIPASITEDHIKAVTDKYVQDVAENDLILDAAVALLPVKRSAKAYEVLVRTIKAFIIQL